MPAKTNDTLSCVTVLTLGVTIGGVACGAVGVAIHHTSKMSDDFVSAAQDMFVLLFVLDCDEKALDMLRCWNPDCTKELLVSDDAKAEDHNGNNK